MKTIMKRFAADQSGATAIEYGLIAALIAVAIIAAVKGVAGSLNTKFADIATKITAAGN
ncbi:Flp family type IVb pilin [Methylobacterium brachythecii]|uniref:Pilus assembly protein n=1 Tax=Methylobacterium brachythecii TaxID=1176177 RepID=A0A7W6F875_9HYPH|nr:Flp family type IVb pilin [Methylobacterium brachythecii]MBB3903876.1 pilus assembly protein Flp/PilA [Methylobacterium brachythecii]GLS42625.1 pilus assembly protein [Methylobacterium brachythecii]